MLLSLISFILGQIGHLTRFSLSGLIATGVNYGALYLFFGLLNIGTFGAATIAFVLSVLVNFTLQKFWAFRDTRTSALPRQMLLYGFVALCMLLINDGVFYAITHFAGLGYLYAQIVATMLVSVFGLVATRRVFAPQYEVAHSTTIR